MFEKYNIAVAPNSRLSLLCYSYCNSMCHAHVMLHDNESVNNNMEKSSFGIMHIEQKSTYYSITIQKTLNSTQLG